MTTIPVSLSALIPVLLVALIGWRLVARVRRLIGRQPIRTRRLVLTAIFFPILVVMLGLSGFRDLGLLEGLAGGVVIGAALAWFGLRLTKFEVTEAGLFYTPNAVIGIALSVLLIARLIYRFGAIYLATGHIDAASIQTMGQSPLTLLILGVLAGYYTSYAIGILNWRHAAGHGAGYKAGHSANEGETLNAVSSPQPPTAP